jgi:hypothetical protein
MKIFIEKECVMPAVIHCIKLSVPNTVNRFPDTALINNNVEALLQPEK